MIIKNIFQNDINRNIETVIKADDRDNISNEVAEYVITNEIAKKVRDFFQAYNDYAGANGVWISGFFGSGKSHLLKILSYVLENKEFDGYKSGELFAEKIEGDEMLRGDVLTATRIPSQSILFNIDQQAQITSKSNENAILSVFYKVFFDHLGYYGFQPHVAEFEMWVDKQGQYEAFKEKFNTKHGKTWEEARIDYFDPLVTDTMAEVLGELNNTDTSKYEIYPRQSGRPPKAVHRGFLPTRTGVYPDHAQGFPAQLFCGRGGAIHQRQHQADAQPTDHRRDLGHEDQGRFLDFGHLPGGYGKSGRRYG